MSENYSARARIDLLCSWIEKSKGSEISRAKIIPRSDVA